MFFFPREVGARWPGLSLSVSHSTPKIHRKSQASLWFVRFPPLVLATRSPISQELDFGGGGPWPGAGALARGLVVPGRPRRQPRCLKGGCIPGSWRQKNRINGHASSNSDLKSGVATAEHGSSWRQQ
eukprot:gene20219-biopygen14616